MKLLKSLTILSMVGGLWMSSALAEGMKMQGQVMGGSMQGGSAPMGARSSDYSDGYKYRGIKGWEETDTIRIDKVLADQTEYRVNNHGNNSLRYDTQAWRGTNYHKLWLKLEGSDELTTRAGNMELQVLDSRSIDSFWEFQMGVRYDRVYSPSITRQRLLAVIGFQGLAPYWFDVEPALFISDKGDVSARVRATYDLLLTQKLILRPRLEINAAMRGSSQFDVGQGLNDVQLGLRLRYEITRKFAPYIGIAKQQQFGATANLLRAAGGASNNISLMTGLRWWF